MSARGAEGLSRPRDELAELLRMVGRLRWRLGWERLLSFALRGLAVVALAVAALLLVDWLLGVRLARPGLIAALPVAVLLAAGLAWARWPSAVEAARVADRRLRLADRLSTAVELAPAVQAGRQRRLDRLQVADAVARAGAASGWPSLAATLRRDLAAAAAATIVAGAAVLTIAVVGDPPRPAADASAASAPATVAAQPTEVAAAPAATSAPVAQPATALPPPAAVAAPADPALPQRAQQEQAQRDALDRLSQQLRQLSATGPAADAIARGDYAAARDGLASLGDQADQLSAAAKSQLAQALKAAAAGSAGDPDLAQREQDAARALGQPDYAAQQKAMRQLGEQVARSGAAAPSAAQAQRDAGLLQAQRDASGQPGGQAASGAGANAAGQGPPTDSGGASQASGAVAAPGPGGAAAGGQGQSGGGSGAGSGTAASALGDPAPPLDAVGEHVEVPVALSGASSARPAPGDAQQAGAPVAGSRVGSVAEAPRDGAAGRLAPEQNQVPGDQRGVVRGYFSGDAPR